MFGIVGYEPKGLRGLTALRGAHGEHLRALQGRRLTDCWIVWDSTDDTWFADAPVVLDFEGRQVEISHNKFDDLHIGWDQIDLTRPITWEYEPGEGMPLTWRNDRPDGLQQFRGERLSLCVFQEWTGADAAQGMVAVGFEFPSGQFLVSNGLDENFIDIGPPDHRYQRHAVEVPSVTEDAAEGPYA